MVRNALLRKPGVILCVLALMSMGLTLASVGPAAAAHKKTIRIAFLSFAVNNPYDAPMLAAAQTTAAADGVKLTVFDANNSPTTQYTQLQQVISSGGYQGIITQPIEDTNLIPLVKLAIKKKIKVVNVDQILGASPATAAVQVKGLSANVVFVPTTIGKTLGQQAALACASFTTCDIGYLYNIEGSTVDTAVHAAFLSALGTAGTVVNDSGQTYFNVPDGQAAVSTELTADPDINVIVAADQGCVGAQNYLTSLSEYNTGKVLLVCWGASYEAQQGVEAGGWFSDVAQAPASEGQLGTQALIKAIETGKRSGALDPVASEPDHGLLTKSDAKQFTPQWTA
ncbi:MAG: sugar ABC transporter substrate-binding protein [Acidimicrobiales bacterium]